MSKKKFIGIGIGLILVVAAAAGYILRPTAKVSAPIEAIPVEVEDAEPEKADAAHADDMDADKKDEEMAAESEEADSGSDMDSTASDEIAAPEGALIFTIIPEESEARFTMDELLRGVPTTVVGVTDQVAGEIAIDPENPANATVGTILVNARDLTTDSEFRNRAINNKILETGKYEFITFEPTSLVNFPENPQIGTELSFLIVGNLTIRDITQEVTFDAQVTVISEERIEGFATTMVPRADYDLQIPSVPSVAEVDEEVLVEIDFVAVTK
jgi:polyisoprenoid-binding protein YceI